MDPRDPIAQSIDYDFESGLQDASRAQAILKMLPRLVMEKPQLRDIQATSGLPQTGQEALADIGALAGQAPSGIGQDVRMGTNLGDIYQKRADQRLTADINANSQELERTRQTNLMNVAQAEQGMGALNWVQRDRDLAQRIKAESRLLNVDARRRIELLFGDAAKAVGPPDSPAYQAYTQHLMKAMRDPARLQALLDPKTGMQAMVSIMDEALAVATGGPPAGPQSQALPPRAAAALDITGRMAGIPETAPTGQPAWQVTPAQQAERDAFSTKIVQAEKMASPGQDPAAVAAQTIQVITPRPPRPAPPQGRQEGNAAAQKRITEWNKNEEERYRAEIDLAERQREKARAVRADEQKQEIARNETLQMFVATNAALSEKLTSARDLRDHEGLDRIVGGFAGLNARTPNISEEARNAIELYNNVTAQQWIQEIQKIRAQSSTGSSGMGPLSDKEGARIQNAASKLGREQSAEQFKKYLDEYIAALENWQRQNTQLYRKSPFYSEVAAPTSPGGLKPLPGAGKRIRIGEM